MESIFCSRAPAELNGWYKGTARVQRSLCNQKSAGEDGGVCNMIPRRCYCEIYCSKLSEGQFMGG